MRIKVVTSYSSLSLWYSLTTPKLGAGGMFQGGRELDTMFREDFMVFGSLSLFSQQV